MLERFVTAQDAGGTFDRALAELRAGAKVSHWMWFVFPQLAGLGTSPTARHYALADTAAARAYLAHPLLGPRLAQATEAMLGWAGRRSAQSVLGPVDALKFASSITLFEHVADSSASDFGRALDAFYDGRRDGRTLSLLGLAPSS